MATKTDQPQSLSTFIAAMRQILDQRIGAQTAGEKALAEAAWAKLMAEHATGRRQEREGE